MFLRKFARPSMMMMMNKMSEGVAATAAAAAKESTTSAAVQELIKSTRDGPVKELVRIYQETIEEIQSVPEDEGYRKDLEATTRERLDICLEEHGDPESIQQRISCGDIQDLVNDAQFEYKILTNLLEWDPWGRNESYICTDHHQYQQEPRTVLGSVPDELYERLKDLAKAASEKDDQLQPRNVSEGLCNDEPPEETFSSDNNSFSDDEPDATSSSDNNNNNP